MPSVSTNKQSATFGKEYWRSLDDFADSPDFQKFVENEFPSELENVLTPANRRTFLKLMGASMALASVGLTGCRRWPDEKIAPFAHRPENYVPGEPQTFATAMELGGVGKSLVATSFDGRPIKIEGNAKDTTMSGGSADIYAQASILTMYDPERSKYPTKKQSNIGEYTDAWAAFQSEVGAKFKEFKENRGSGLAIVTEATSSPSFSDIKQRIIDAMPNARWYEYESISRSNELEGAKQAFGKAVRTQYDVSKADVIVCLDSDFLITHPAAAKNAREFARNRSAVNHTMGRLYAAEGVLSLTGANADHRLSVKSRDIAAVAGGIARKLGTHGVNALGSNEIPGDSGDKWAEWIDAVVADLSTHKGKSIVVAGSRQPAAVHALVHSINYALGNVGYTVNYTDEPGGRHTPHVNQMKDLVAKIQGNMVKSVIVLGGNPVYDTPSDIDFEAQVLTGREFSLHLSLYNDETSNACIWHVPMAHYLESWSDSRTWDGTILATQPLIEPLYKGMTATEMLAMLLDDELKSGYGIARRWLSDRRGEDNFETVWRNYLHDGVLANSKSPYVNESISLKTGAWTTAVASLINAASSDSSYEVVYVQDAGLYDGRFANNGWLQELPDPIAKIAWDNAAFMGVSTAENNNLRGDDLCTIAVGDGKSLKIAVHIVPGIADSCIVINLGYGRTRAGHIGNTVGFNANELRTTGAMDFAGDLSVKKIKGSYPLATLQDHHAMRSDVTDAGLQERLPLLIHEATLDRFEKEGKGAFSPKGHHEHHLPVISLWDDQGQFGEAPHKWAMTIDLNACTGCSACVIACQAENNIPIVGKDQIARGREMHWIRIDRYFKGYNLDNPEVVFQPVNCMHCENAPCEQVCPVAATTHDRDGLNVMVYNRCVGTRYCSNNCPYKVRRFNFYDWHVEDPRQSGLKPPSLGIPDQVHAKAFDGDQQVRKMGFNPDVTVRMRGVMEKCTYCTQRINRAKIKAKNAFVSMPDAEKSGTRVTVDDTAVAPACAQTCPSEAIVFGDLMDPNSNIRKQYAKSDRLYALLELLNVKPRTQYLGKVRNYNSSLKAPESGGNDAKDDNNNDGEVSGH